MHWRPLQTDVSPDARIATHVWATVGRDSFSFFYATIFYTLRTWFIRVRDRKSRGHSYCSSRTRHRDLSGYLERSMFAQVSVVSARDFRQHHGANKFSSPREESVFTCCTWSDRNTWSSSAAAAALTRDEYSWTPCQVYWIYLGRRCYSDLTNPVSSRSSKSPILRDALQSRMASGPRFRRRNCSSWS